MFSILTAIVSGIAVATLFRLTLVHSLPAAILPGVVALLAVLIILVRRIGAQLNPIMEEAQRHMKGGRRELALASLRSGLRLKTWHPLLEGQLRAQIGALEYVNGDLDDAISELSRSSLRPWESRGFLGCAYYKKNDDAAMTKAFEEAVKSGKDDSLSWTVYAYCLNGRNKNDKAIAVLERGAKQLPKDARLTANLEALKTGKKLKVSGYGDRWASFLLDGAMPGIPKQARGFAQRPGFRQRPQRRR